MIYIAFIQGYTSRPCQGDNCIGMLANNLTTIFLTRMISSIISGVVVPMAMDHYQRKKEAEEGKVRSEVRWHDGTVIHACSSQPSLRALLEVSEYSLSACGLCMAAGGSVQAGLL
jgi:hypothetical protein